MSVPPPHTSLPAACGLYLTRAAPFYVRYTKAHTEHAHAWPTTLLIRGTSIGTLLLIKIRDTTGFEPSLAHKETPEGQLAARRLHLATSVPTH